MTKALPIEYSIKKLAYMAGCHDCGKCVFMVTEEAIRSAPRRPSGSSILLPVTMTVHHDCEGKP